MLTLQKDQRPEWSSKTGIKFPTRQLLVQGVLFVHNLHTLLEQMSSPLFYSRGLCCSIFKFSVYHFLLFLLPSSDHCLLGFFLFLLPIALSVLLCITVLFTHLRPSNFSCKLKITQRDGVYNSPCVRSMKKNQTVAVLFFSRRHKSRI